MLATFPSHRLKIKKAEENAHRRQLPEISVFVSGFSRSWAPVLTSRRLHNALTVERSQNKGVRVRLSPPQLRCCAWVKLQLLRQQRGTDLVVDCVCVWPPQEQLAAVNERRYREERDGKAEERKLAVTSDIFLHSRSVRVLWRCYRHQWRQWNRRDAVFFGVTSPVRGVEFAESSKAVVVARYTFSGWCVHVMKASVVE